jgi:hypothetical protein
MVERLAWARPPPHREQARAVRFDPNRTHWVPRESAKVRKHEIAQFSCEPPAVDSLRVSVLYWTLGTALGILLHIVLFPASIAHIFPLAERKERFLAEATRNPMTGLLSSSGATTSGTAGPMERSFDSQPHERIAG